MQIWNKIEERLQSQGWIQDNWEFTQSSYSNPDYPELRIALYPFDRSISWWVVDPSEKWHRIGRTTQSRSLEIQEHGLMMSDYFGGTNGVWINLYPDHSTTKEDLLNMLEQEINEIWDYIKSVAKNHNFRRSLSTAIDRQIAEMREYIKGCEGDFVCPDTDISDYEDDENPAYIFTIEFNTPC